jgi:formylglycine-generating enzyme required for sulfatase activity
VKIFLSYASEDRAIAEQIRSALIAQGHDVFLDRDDLPAGSEFHGRIRQAIERSNLLVFLLSPEAVDRGSYTLTELEIAERTWPQPAGRILPVLLRATDLNLIPNYAKSVSFLSTDGNLPAAVVDAVHRIGHARTRPWLVKGALAALVGFSMVAGTFYWLGHSRVNEMTREDGAPLLRIPGGVFVMGDGETAARRQVYTDEFYIDTFEVTIARYTRFLKATALPDLPENWEETSNARTADLPVVGVTWHEAQAYCKWTGARLPTEAEWEKAARGSDGRLFPWGDETPSPARANFANTSPKAYDGGLTRVGSYAAGRSPFGIHDMAGNAAEWVEDWFSDTAPREDSRNPRGPANGTAKVVRGGGRFDPGDRISSARRYFADPNHRSEEIGFRCAR